MFLVKFFVSLSVVAALTIGIVSAEDRKGPAPGGPIGVAQSVPWEEFKDRCLHWDQYEVQKAPQNIRIQCNDISVEFVPAAAGEVALSSARSVMATVLADKFYVATGAQNVPMVARAGSCLRFKEVEKNLVIERPLSCDEVVGMKGDPSDFCQQSLDIAKSANPKLIQVRDTGRIIDTCSNVAVTGKDARK
ncbi:MAG: hypothetical protein NDJ90_05815 [Oligoflexia bacterium]|nr:hypothetical protein [Oligoflexia bacterium]